MEKLPEHLIQRLKLEQKLELHKDSFDNEQTPPELFWLTKIINHNWIKLRDIDPRIIRVSHLNCKRLALKNCVINTSLDTKIRLRKTLDKLKLKGTNLEVFQQSFDMTSISCIRHMEVAAIYPTDKRLLLTSIHTQVEPRILIGHMDIHYANITPEFVDCFDVKRYIIYFSEIEFHALVTMIFYSEDVDFVFSEISVLPSHLQDFNASIVLGKEKISKKIANETHFKCHMSGLDLDERCLTEINYDECPDCFVIKVERYYIPVTICWGSTEVDGICDCCI